MKRRISITFVAVLTAALCAVVGPKGSAGAQVGPISSDTPVQVSDLADLPLNRPTLEQRYRMHEDTFFPSLLGLRSPGVSTIRTRHFIIYYTNAEETARRIAAIADDSFEKISRYYPTSLKRYRPISVLVDDGVDVLGNAFAVYNNNYIQFWATPFDIAERGTSDWVENVFVHELTHIISLKSAHNAWPFTFGIVSTSQSNQNPDYSFTLPLYHLTVPSWYVEGIAQFEAQRFGDETWDTHRDMLLRMSLLEGEFLSLSQMGVFGQHGEMNYNTGYAFLNFIADQYGEDKVRLMSEQAPVINFRNTMKSVLGVSATQVYADWKAHLEEKYGALKASVEASGEREGERIFDGGSRDFYPAYSPDGTKVAFVSNPDEDYTFFTRLFVMDLTTRKLTEVAQGGRFGENIGSRFSWTPDGSQLVYVKSQGGRWDLFRYDLASRQEYRITASLRGKDPSVSPDGSRIAFVGNRDGSQEIGVVNMDGTESRLITNHNDGTQYYGPRWSPDGKQILFSVFRGEDRDIAVIRAGATPRPKPGEESAKMLAPADTVAAAAVDSASTETQADSILVFPDSVAYAMDAEFRPILHSKADERDPVWLPDGSGIVYASDRTGVFNIYVLDLETGHERQITNVIGGAFVPTVSPSGEEIIYAGYHAFNHNLYRIPIDHAVTVAASENIERDYKTIYTGDDLETIYDVGRGGGGRLTSYGVTPFLLLGPTFIGNRFGLDQISFGTQAAWGQLLGNDVMTVWGTVGKNLRKNHDLNSEFAAFYQTTLPSVESEQKTIVPSFLIGGSRQTINSLVDVGTVASQRDTSSGTLQAVIDSQVVIIPNAVQQLNLTLKEVDEFKDTFSEMVVGSSIRLGSNHGLGFYYDYRSYSENLKIRQNVLDSTRVYQNGTDITEQLGGTNTDTEVLNDFIYKDLRFYKSHDFTANWSYANFKYTYDQFLNPTGGRAVTLRYRRINATVTDSLALSIDLNQDGIPDPSETDVSPSLFREDNVNLGINEFIFSWNEFLELPGRTTLSLQSFVGYRDQVIKDPLPDGGTFEGVFYYPLRYYLGGMGTLRGYPYFTLSGGKVAFGRANFTFPIVKKGGRELPPFFFDKVYGSFFIEAGGTGNFDSVKDLNDFNEDAFLVDYGIELRLEAFQNYRLPMFGYFLIAWPMHVGGVKTAPSGSKAVRDRNDPTVLDEIDGFRIYFGLSI